MSKDKTIKAYFRGLEEGSYEAVISLFSPTATVHSPLYGKMSATDFYKDLFADTQTSKIVLKNIFLSTNNPKAAAAHFVYSWVMKDEAQVSFECVDVFDFDPATGKVSSLTIIYDTFHTRPEFQKMKASEK